MMGTFNCTYETPCGWCTKWDKKCDRKIGCNKDRDLENIKAGHGLAYSDVRKICGKTMFIPYENLNHITTSGL